MKKYLIIIMVILIPLYLLAQKPTAQIGKKAPNFKLEDIDGNVVELKSLLGKGPVLINFWATWCKPCLEELYQFQKTFDEYKSRGFNLITISTDNEKTVGKVKPFIRTKNYTFTVLLDKNSEVAKKYYAYQIPFTVLIDKEGNILYTNMGYIKGSEIKIKQILDEILGS